MPERIKRIEIGDLTEVVTSAVNRALASSPDPVPWRNPRIIIGLIYEPNYPPPPVEEQQ